MVTSSWVTVGSYGEEAKRRVERAGLEGAKENWRFRGSVKHDLFPLYVNEPLAEPGLKLVKGFAPHLE